MTHSENRRNAILHIALWAGVALLVLKTLSLRLNDPDLWWHLNAGREMVENRVFLTHDIFSYSMRGVEWINFEWLSQILLYLTYKVTGISGIFYLKMTMCLAVLGVLIQCLKKAGARGWGLLYAFLTGFWILRPRLYERVELSSLLFLSVFTLLLSQSRYHPSKDQKRIPWILFGLMVLWCNLHGGFVYGVALVLLVHLGAWWSREDKDYLSMTAHSVILVLLGTMINPFGPKLYAVLFEHATQLHRGLHFIQEWAPTSVDSMPIFWVLFVTVGILVVAGVLAHRPEAFFWAPTVLVFSVWAGVAQRNVALAVFSMLTFTVDIVSKWEYFHPVRSSSVAQRGAAVGILVFLLFQWSTLFRPWPKDKVQWAYFPLGACRFLSEQNIRGRLYNSYDYGGYIEWALGKNWPILMDGRYLFYPLLTEHTALNHQLMMNPVGRAWGDYLKRWNMDVAITNYGDFVLPSMPDKAPFVVSPLNAMFPRSEWALVYWDHTALVFLRRTPGHAEAIRQFEYRTLWPYNLDQMKHLLDSKAISAAEVRQEIKLHEQRVGFTVIGNEMKRMIDVE